jgi:uncharacterized SAM-binding protein YcdF (DUF218 family)
MAHAMKKRRGIFLLTLLTFMLAASWLTGLVLFVATVTNLREPAIDAGLPPTEAIVVLTGGSERLDAGLALLSAGKGKKLLVSGVHPGLQPDHVLAGHPVPADLKACCIALGHAADSTIGNAGETRQWMRDENLKTMRLVTAHYHMPRSLLVFQDSMPDMTIIPHAVAPESVHLSDWWRRPGTASLLVTEYDKYLSAMLYLRLKKTL